VALFPGKQTEAALEFLLIKKRNREKAYAAVGTAPMAWQIIEQCCASPIKPAGGLVEQRRRP
jgi:hypothetical protein